MEIHMEQKACPESNETMVYVLFTSSSEFQKDDLESWLQHLPNFIVQRYRRYKNINDGKLFVLGKLLLFRGFELFGQVCKLQALQFNPFGKPYIKGDIHFSTSHSGEYVVCAFAKNSRLGIDIEKVENKNLEFGYFKPYFNNSEWNHISSSKNMLQTFYQYWTIKESIVKAEGLGMSRSFKQISLEKDYVTIGDTNWHFTPISIDDDYVSTLCLEKSSFQLHVQKNSFLSVPSDLV
ncbi:MAG: 4'-phosphopantetheinyl transferase family protein [Flavisolibacter sp.]